MKQAKEGVKKKILVTTDSAVDLTPEWIRMYGIRVIHHRLHTDTGVFEDRTEINSDELCDYLADETKSARSEVPDAEDFRRFFSGLLPEAEEILHITISHQASPVYGQAMQAEKAFDRVHVFDSGDMAGGAGLFALLAAHLVTQGQAVPEITETLMRFKQEIRSTYVLSGTSYLQKGGRMSPFLSALLTAFLLHPVIVMKNDRMNFRFSWSQHYKENYIRRMLWNVKHIDPSLLIISHSACTEEELARVREEVRRYAHFDRVAVVPTSSAVTVNVGPGTFGLVFRVAASAGKQRRLFDFLPQLTGGDTV